MPHSCTPECTAGWQPGNKCHCRSCGETFTSVTAFDHHRLRGECQSPSTRGLIQNNRGNWQFPGDKDYDAIFRR